MGQRSTSRIALGNTCFDYPQARQHGGGHDPGGECPLRGRHHPGWDTGLCPESRRRRFEQRHGLGDRHGHQHWPGYRSRWGLPPIGLAVSPDGTKVYVTNFGPPAVSTGTVSVIKTANRGVVATIPVGNYPTGVAFTPDGTHAYVANVNSSIVSVIATATNTVVATVMVDSPVAVAITPDGTRGLRREISLPRQR